LLSVPWWERVPPLILRLIPNLATVEAHFHSEAANEVDEALKLYTDDIVWEAPARNMIFQGKEDVGNNYRKIRHSTSSIRRGAP